MPANYAEGKPEALEGYPGWAGLCLAAASLGVRILREDCLKGLELAKQRTGLERQHLTINTSLAAITKSDCFHLFEKHPGLLRSLCEFRSQINFASRPTFPNDHRSGLSFT
jgi:hypothetical protein